MTAPVSLCMIVKNEVGQLKKCLESIRPYVEEICIVDTGSTDGTPDIARSFADRFEIFTDCNDSNGLINDFTLARAKSFSLATRPWLFWIDGDDEVVGADKLSEIIAKYDLMRKGAPAYIMLPYEYAHDAVGNVICVHSRERLITPKEAFIWSGPVHEVLIPIVPNVQRSELNDIKIIHHRNTCGKVMEPGRNLRILKAYYEKMGDQDARQLYYLGLEYGNVNDTANSIRFHKRYVELSGWDDEKCLACLEIAKHYRSSGDYENAIEWALKASTVREGWAEPYFSLAKSYYFSAQRGGPHENRNWEKCIFWSELGLSRPPTNTLLFVNPIERKFDIHRFYNLALSKIGRVEQALESVQQGLSVYPDDKDLLLNKKVYEIYLTRNQINSSLNALVQYEEIDQSTSNKVQETLQIRPKKLETKEETSLVSENKVDTKETEGISLVKYDGKHDIIMYVGGSVEPWNPVTMAKHGIGGSETAVIEMSKCLTKLGYSVRVYNDCISPDGSCAEGTYDGVQYIHHSKYRDLKCDILIASRRPDAFDDELNIKRDISFCWVHDIHLGQALTAGRALRVNKLLALSEWHRQLLLSRYPFLDASKVIKTQNGINLSKFDKQVIRNPHRAVYSSSPDRGMEIAIKVWPRIREKINDAELHIFYGFKTWEIMARHDEGQSKLIEKLKQLLHDNEPNGVFYHGRVNQNELAEEYLKSGVWPYSTWFSETSAISAMEAQAAGLRIVTSPIAALNETVGIRGVMISGDWLSQDYQDKFVDAVINAMSNSDDSDRKVLQQYAHDNFSWEKVADDWIKMFSSVMEESKSAMMPMYKGVI